MNSLVAQASPRSPSAELGSLTGGCFSVDPALKFSMQKETAATNIANGLVCNISCAPDGRVTTSFESTELDQFAAENHPEILQIALGKIGGLCAKHLVALEQEVTPTSTGQLRTPAQLLFSDRLVAILRASFADDLCKALIKSDDGLTYGLSGRRVNSEPEKGKASKAGMYCVALAAVLRSSEGAEQVYQFLTGGRAGGIGELSDSFVSEPAVAISFSKRTQADQPESPERVVVYFTN